MVDGHDWSDWTLKEYCVKGEVEMVVLLKITALP